MLPENRCLSFGAGGSGVSIGGGARRRAVSSGGGCMRRLLFLFSSAAVLVAGSLAPASAGTAIGPHDVTGQESQDAADAADWFTSQRLAPHGAVNANAFAAVAGQAGSLGAVGGPWAARPTPSGAAGVDFSHTPPHTDPPSKFTHSGGGDRYLPGPISRLATPPD